MKHRKSAGSRRERERQRESRPPRPTQLEWAKERATHHDVARCVGFPEHKQCGPLRESDLSGVIHHRSEFLDLWWR
jgi:hypothetical protein